MKTAHLDDMTKGWFVGNFDPSLFKTKSAEIAVKRFIKGETEVAHFHKIATEITVVVSGTVKMFNRNWNEGDIIVAEPYEVTSFEAITDSVLTVVKLPGANNDKYIA